jgi:hypothetical protein
MSFAKKRARDKSDRTPVCEQYKFIATKKDKFVMGKIAYITTNAPFEKGEGFVVNEMVMLKNLGANLVIFPRDFSRDIFHRGGEVLVPEAYPIPIFSLGILKDFKDYHQEPNRIPQGSTFGKKDKR